jgi:hypothetical protein
LNGLGDLFEAVAEAVDGFDEVFGGASEFEFGAEAFDVGFDGFFGGWVLEGPDPIDDAGPTEYPTTVADEEVEEGVFLGGELEGFTSVEDFVGAGVHFEVAPEAIAAVADLVAPAEEGADAGHEFLEVEGFDHVVVGSGVEAVDFVGDGVAGGEHEDWGGELVAAQAATEADAVDFGEGDVEDEEVVLGGGHAVPAHFAVGREIDDVLAIAQGFVEHFGEVDIIFDDKNAHGRV